MRTATLDTNLLLEYWKEQPKAAVVERLLDLAQDSQLDLAVTSRISADVPRPPLSERINDLPELDIATIGSVFRLDFSFLDGEDVLAGGTRMESFIAVADRITEDFLRRSHKPPDVRDWDHLHGHYLAGRDVFLTWDKRILDVAPGLQDELGIVVMKPEDYLSVWGEPVEPEAN